MKVLYVTGACLTKNTSANMSHNAFLSGFIENDYQVDVIMANDSWGEEDSALPKYNKAIYHEYNAVSFADKLRKSTRGVIPAADNNSAHKNTREKPNVKQIIRNIAKSLFYFVFKNHPDYGSDWTWIKNASKYKTDVKYDLVVSNSSPAASHKLVQILTDKMRIKYDRWIQIWEDPWYHDLYGGRPESTKNEEHSLLQSASEIYYVSPLTLMYQKQFFADCAEKMKCIPLPFLDFSNAKRQGNTVNDSFGYFGDYYLATRNLQPFYDALAKSGNRGYIYGDSDLVLKSTDKIMVSGRVTLDILSKVQKKTDVLVHLSNLKGGQIPGKIYHYSATTKPILFILDGTDDEKKALLEFFGKFDRYYFCENETEAILQTMRKICSEKKSFKPVEQFSPKNVIQKIIATK